MKDLNQVQLTGRLGADPELKTSSKGMSYCRLNLGVQSSKKQGDSWVDQTDWLNITTFGKTAENLAKQAKKGSQLLVTGTLKAEVREVDGKKQHSTSIMLSDFKLFSQPAAQPQQKKSEEFEDFGDDIPF